MVQYSTNAYINAAYSNAYTQTRVPTLRSAEMDDNRDGKTDRLEVSVLLPITADESISGFTAAVYLDVKLNERAKVLFDGVGFVHYEGSTPLQKLSVDGDMMLRQTWPLKVYGGYRRLYENDALYDVDSTTPAQDVFIQSVMQKYNARNGKSYQHVKCIIPLSGIVRYSSDTLCISYFSYIYPQYTCMHLFFHSFAGISPQL
ncbi:hypothetical protein EON65_04175 [archaeon]|nr:MAG: hypothetical protein EON65_04175 [archaeon]